MNKTTESIDDVADGYKLESKTKKELIHFIKIQLATVKRLGEELNSWYTIVEGHDKIINELNEAVDRLREERDKIKRESCVMLGVMEDEIKRLNKKLKNNTIRTITLER